MLEFLVIIGFFSTLTFVVTLIVSFVYFGDSGNFPLSIVAILVVAGIVATLSWTKISCIEAHSYTYYATDKQEKVIEMLAEITDEDEFYVAGVVLLCDEELSIAEMAMAIDGDITPEDAESFQRIVEIRLKELDDKE